MCDDLHSEHIIIIQEAKINQLHPPSSHSIIISKHISLLQLDLELNYTALMFYKQMPNSVHVKFKLVVVPEVEALLRVKFT